MIRFLLKWAVNIYIIILITRWVVEGFFPQYTNTGWFLRIKDVTEPLLEKIRGLVPAYNGFDFSYIIAIAGLKLLSLIIIAIL
ncbi:MAG: YggT family protein [Fibrobacteria bacterium]|nr:YggT family protein [Fibrobacteria bacterium]